MLDDWSDFRQSVTRTAVRWWVALSIIWLIWSLIRMRFELNRFGLELFGLLFVSVIIGVMKWARDEAKAPLSGGGK